MTRWGVRRLALFAAASVLLLACGSSSKNTTAGTSPTSIATSTSTSTSTSTTAAATASTTAAAASGLSGTWSGQYSGAGQGTFNLTWQQAGSDLSGTITISGSAPTSLTGTVAGNTIRFGTVGSTAITYSGSFSGNTMSGTYQAPAGNGSWTATKTS
jgi:hypothetical protein